MKKTTLLFTRFLVLAALLIPSWTVQPAASMQAPNAPLDAGLPWFHPSWHYRTSVTITNSGVALTFYQVLVQLDNTNFDFSQANSDGSDLRVTDSDGITPLPFWIESWASSLAYVWIKVPSIPANSTATVYLYFGNATATSLSRGDLTFELFDDAWCQFPGATGCGATNPVLSAGQSWWENTTGYPAVFEDTSFLPGRPRYHMLYSGYQGGNYSKGYAWSSDLNTWTENVANPVMGPTSDGGMNLTYGDVAKVDTTYYMFAIRGVAQRMESTDLINWSNFTDLTLSGMGAIGSGMAILKEGDGITPVVVNGYYWMVYFQNASQGSMFLAYSSNLVDWTTTGYAILDPTPSTWDSSGLWTPSFILVGNTYYIYYQGYNGTVWGIGYARADASGGVEPPADTGSWTKSTDSVIKRGSGSSWDNAFVLHPMFRHFSDGLYYVFYTGNSAIGYAYATSPEGPWTKLGGSTSQWTIYNGGPTVSGGVASFTAGRGMRSNATFNPGMAMGFRASYPTSNGQLVWAGFITQTGAPFSLISTRRSTSNL